MTEIIQKKLSDSPVARWTALIIVSFTMMWGYFLNDAMSPLMTMLEQTMHWSSSEFGIFNWSYCWFNVFLGMLIVGGIILDKLGIRFTGITACLLMVIGALVKYYAVQYISPDVHINLFFDINMRLQVFVACLGFATFAMGSEICGITVSKIIVKWFTGKELALAMGTQVAVARMGTAFAMFFSPIIVKHFNVSTPLFLSMIMLTIGLMAYIVYCVMDARLDKQTLSEHPVSDEDAFHLSDLKLIVTNKGFWLIATLCLMFYSAVFPFLKFAASLMENKYGLSPEFAGMIPSLLPLGNMLMTPYFGSIYDRKGKGATIMIIGSMMLILVHLLFALPILNYWWFAAFVVIVLGVAFSLVPSAMWPSVPKIIPQKQLGSAYALIFWVQNIGLGFVPLLIGMVLNKYCIVGERMVDGEAVSQYNYTLPMIIFCAFGVIALWIAFMLKAEDKKKGYGLEKANMQKQ